MKQLTLSERIDLKELEFEIDQATRWLDGTFDKYLNGKTREWCARGHILLALMWCSNVKSWSKSK